MGGGVCQDFAHLLIGLCRAVDIPARYVSGYIVPGEGRDEPHRGGGASHAWAEAYMNTHGWRGFDATNDLVAADPDPGHISRRAEGEDLGQRVVRVGRVLQHHR